MGTTLDMLNAYGGAVTFVAQIEGYDTLLVSDHPAEVLTAWQDADLPGNYDAAHAVSGLCVHWSQEQRHSPWTPFGQPPMLAFSVVAGRDENGDDTDAFGAAVAKRTSTLQTSLIAALDPNDTTATVRSTAAFPGSGTVHVGAEAMAYTTTAADEFQTLTRGLYSPFHTSSSARFARTHHAFDPSTAVGDALAVRIPPVVADEQRDWVGRWVGVWICRRSTGSVIDGPDDALLAFAGQIAEVTEGEHGETIVECEHALRSVYDRNLFANPYQAIAAEGVQLKVGASNDFTCVTTRVATSKTANPLTIVSGAPASVNEIQEGVYTIYELGAAINAWLQAEYAAARLMFSVSYDAAYDNGTDGPRGVLSYSDSGGSAGDIRRAVVTWPTAMVSRYLGWDGNTTISIDTITSTSSIRSPKTPLRFLISNLATTVTVTNPRGVWIDQGGILPTPLHDPSGLEDGVIRIGDSGHAVVQHVSDTELGVLFSSSELNRYLPALDPNPGTAIEVPIDDDRDLSVSQVILAEASFKDLLLQILFSTGASGFNHATYDTLSAELGCALPYQLGGADLVADVAACADADEPLVVVLRKPTRFVDLFNVDMILRWSFFTWGAGRIRLRTWGTPTSGAAVLAIDDNDKGLPPSAAESDPQRSRAVERLEFIRNIVTVTWGQDATGELVRPPIPILDVVSMSVHGDRAIELKARNTLARGQVGDFLGVVSRFAAGLSLFSRPHRVVRRTMGLHHFEQLVPGTFVTITDHDVRDPETGLHYSRATDSGGLTGWPGIVVANEHDWGGSRPGLGGPAPEPDDPFGEVEIMIFDRVTASPYSPAAQVDETASTGGYSAGYNDGAKTLKLREHEHSGASDAADSSRFAAGDEVRIVQIDPDNPAAPITWLRTVASVSTNELVLTATLSAPAWDATKIYRVVPQDYATVQGSQRSSAFQADDADGLVSGTRQPYAMVVSGTGQANPFTGSAATELPARWADVASGDGVALDVAYARDAGRLANNLVSYKTGPQTPAVCSEARSGSPTGTWKLVTIEPVAVGIGELFASQTRKLSVAPQFRSKTGGSVSVRVSLCRLWPQGDSLHDATLVDPYVSATFTTTSTTYVTATAQDLDIAHLNLSPSSLGGLGWLAVEVNSGNAEVLGLARRCLGPVVAP